MNVAVLMMYMTILAIIVVVNTHITTMLVELELVTTEEVILTMIGVAEDTHEPHQVRTIKEDTVQEVITQEDSTIQMVTVMADTITDVTPIGLPGEVQEDILIVDVERTAARIPY
jgi:hypothetical protein